MRVTMNRSAVALFAFLAAGSVTTYAWSQSSQMTTLEAGKIIVAELEPGCKNEFAATLEIKRTWERRMRSAGQAAASEQQVLDRARNVDEINRLPDASAAEASKLLNETSANADLDGPFSTCIWKRRVEQIANNGGVTPPWPRRGDVAAKTTATVPIAAPAPSPAPVASEVVELNSEVKIVGGGNCMTIKHARSFVPTNADYTQHNWTFENDPSCPRVRVMIDYGKRSASVFVKPGEKITWFCLERRITGPSDCIGGEIATAEEVAP